MSDSILNSIKKLLGIGDDYTEFDADIIMHINSVLAILTQVGVGPKNGFMITDATATWDQFIQNDSKLMFVVSYVHLRVKLLFDPPTSSAVIDAIKNTISELEFRLFVETDPQIEEGVST